MLAALPAGAQEKKHALFLLGNTYGDTAATLPLLRAAVQPDSTTTLLFLGADLPPAKSGAPDTAYPLVDAVALFIRGTGAQAVFLPGTTEWQGATVAGTAPRLEALGAYLKKLKRTDLRMPLKNGCPGPALLELSPDAALILMDSPWWLQDGHRRPGIESACGEKNEQQILDELDDLLNENNDRLVILAAHHPLRSTGARAGYFGFKQHLFPLTDIRGLERAYLPLPLAGSLYPAGRALFTGRADAAHPRHARFISAVEELVEEHPFVVTAGAAAGTLQMVEDDGGRYHLVSGTAGGRGRRVTRARGVRYGTSAQGIVRLDISANRSTTVEFNRLLRSEGGMSEYTAPDFYFTTPPDAAAGRGVAAVPIPGTDSVRAAVYPRYADAGPARQWLLGRNWRAEWATPVALPVLNLTRTYGGYTVVGKGGGNTTTAIRLLDRDSAVWSLRSVTKDPRKLLPEGLRATVAEDVLRDIGSSAHPFAGTVAAGLADAAGIPRPRLRYVWMPGGDTALGAYDAAFARTVAVLEERQYSRYGEGTKGTWSVVNDLVEKGGPPVDARSYLRGRLMDILLADYDRHYAQWKWGTRDSAGVKTRYAIPKDRDQAMALFDGTLLKVLSIRDLKYLRGFRPRIEGVVALGFVSRDVDNFFLSPLDEAAWRSEIGDLTAHLPDTAIHTAVARLPPSVYAVRGAHTERTLRHRRDDLARRGLDYYRFLARYVTVTGTAGRDSIVVSRADSGIAVAVWGTGEDKRAGRVLRYNRVLRPRETREVRIYGFGGADHFRVAPDVPRGIRLRLVGCGGADTFHTLGHVRTWVYDAAGGGASVQGRRAGTVNMISSRGDVNAYTFRTNDYPSIRIPTFQGGSNPEDGVLIGVGASVTRRGFRVEPFGSAQRLSALIAPVRGAFQVRYSGEFNDWWRHYDGLVNTAIVEPVLQNFFGLGNETARDAGRPRRYYRVRYSYAAADLLLRRRFFGNRLSVAAGPAVFHYWHRPDRADNRVLSQPETVGLSRADVFISKLYGGARASALFRSLDDALLPTRGVRWTADFTAMGGLNTASSPITRGTTDLEVYAPLGADKRLVLALRGGGGKVFSERYEFFQAVVLGAGGSLRGYRKARFAGESAVYGAAEVRARVARFRSRIVPGDLGVIGFGETGRVWVDGEQSTKWHPDWGGGLYYTPFNTVLVSLTLAVSEEEKLLNGSVGAGLNFTF